VAPVERPAMGVESMSNGFDDGWSEGRLAVDSKPSRDSAPIRRGCWRGDGQRQQRVRGLIRDKRNGSTRARKTGAIRACWSLQREEKREVEMRGRWMHQLNATEGD
jgi:hypothetical protein